MPPPPPPALSSSSSSSSSTTKSFVVLDDEELKKRLESSAPAALEFDELDDDLDDEKTLLHVVAAEAIDPNWCVTSLTAATNGTGAQKKMDCTRIFAACSFGFVVDAAAVVAMATIVAMMTTAAVAIAARK